MAFINLPPVPADAAPALREQMETYRVEYFAPEPAQYEQAFAIAENFTKFRPETVADLAAKLILAVHHLSPGKRHDTLFNVDKTSINCDPAAGLLFACIDDAIRLAASEPAGTAAPDVASFMASIVPDMRRLGDC